MSFSSRDSSFPESSFTKHPTACYGQEIHYSQELEQPSLEVVPSTLGSVHVTVFTGGRVDGQCMYPALATFSSRDPELSSMTLTYECHLD